MVVCRHVCRARLLGALFRAGCFFALVWAVCAYYICQHCNRIGNFIDSWYQLQLTTALKDAAAPTEASEWIDAVNRMEYHVRGVGRGILLHRWLRLDFGTRSVAAHIAAAASLPPPTFWSSAGALDLRERLRAGDIHHHFWANITLVRLVLPHLRPSLQALVASFASSQTVRGTSDHVRVRTCVIHYRSGDFLQERGREAASSAAALVRAARSFTQRPLRFELLDGGVRTHLCSPHQRPHQQLRHRKAARHGMPGAGQRGGAGAARREDCGASFADVLERALDDAFPTAAIVRIVGATADDDFVRMALAPMLLVGGGSYALFGALASRGEVRLPRCVLRFAEDGPCLGRSANLSDGVRGYDHPRCRCPGEPRSRALPHRPPPAVPSDGESDGESEAASEEASEQALPSQRRPEDERGAERFLAASYSLPERDLSDLRRVLKLSAGVYEEEHSHTAGRKQKEAEGAAGRKQKEAEGSRRHRKGSAYEQEVSTSKSALERAAASASAARRTVLLTSINAAYVELYQNWACFARTHRLKHLVWAQDRIAAAMLLPPRAGSAAAVEGDSSGGRSALFYSADMASVLGSVPWAASFRSRSFNHITLFKLVAVRLVLRAGWDAWLCDVDVVFRGDPWPLFARAADGAADGAAGEHRRQPLRCDYEYAANEKP